MRRDDVWREGGEHGLEPTFPLERRELIHVEKQMALD